MFAPVHNALLIAGRQPISPRLRTAGCGDRGQGARPRHHCSMRFPQPPRPSERWEFRPLAVRRWRHSKLRAVRRRLLARRTLPCNRGRFANIHPAGFDDPNRPDSPGFNMLEQLNSNLGRPISRIERPKAPRLESEFAEFGRPACEPRCHSRRHRCSVLYRDRRVLVANLIAQPYRSRSDDQSERPRHREPCRREEQQQHV